MNSSGVRNTATRYKIHLERPHSCDLEFEGYKRRLVRVWVQRSNALVLVAGQLQKGFFFMRNFRLEALAAMNNLNLMNIMSTNPTLPSINYCFQYFSLTV